MPKQNQQADPASRQPGPGRSTADAAFDELRREIARRNEQIHQAARKVRAKQDREKRITRRERDL